MLLTTFCVNKHLYSKLDVYSCMKNNNKKKEQGLYATDRATITNVKIT